MTGGSRGGDGFAPARRRSLHLARGDPGRAGAGLGAERECAHIGRAAGRRALPGQLRPGARPSCRRATASRWSASAPTASTISGRTPTMCAASSAAPPSPATAPTTPEWETVLDVDALARGRGQVLGLSGHAMPAARGAALPRQPLRRRPRRQCRARVRPSAPAASSTGGFSLPEGKQIVAWEDADTILLSRATGGRGR